MRRLLIAGVAVGAGLKINQISQEMITKRITDQSFLRSYTLDKIGPHLAA